MAFHSGFRQKTFYSFGILWSQINWGFDIHNQERALRYCAAKPDDGISAFNNPFLFNTLQVDRGGFNYAILELASVPFFLQLYHIL